MAGGYEPVEFIETTIFDGLILERTRFHNGHQLGNVAIDGASWTPAIMTAQLGLDEYLVIHAHKGPDHYAWAWASRLWATSLAYPLREIEVRLGQLGDGRLDADPIAVWIGEISLVDLFGDWLTITARRPG